MSPPRNTVAVIVTFLAFKHYVNMQKRNAKQNPRGVKKISFKKFVQINACAYICKHLLA